MTENIFNRCVARSSDGHKFCDLRAGHDGPHECTFGTKMRWK